MDRAERLKRIQAAYAEFSTDLKFVDETGGSDKDESEFMTHLAEMKLTSVEETK
jgi:hypothetical protein